MKHLFFDFISPVDGYLQKIIFMIAFLVTTFIYALCLIDNFKSDPKIVIVLIIEIYLLTLNSLLHLIIVIIFALNKMRFLDEYFQEQDIWEEVYNYLNFYKENSAIFAVVMAAMLFIAFIFMPISTISFALISVVIHRRARNSKGITYILVIIELWSFLLVLPGILILFTKENINNQQTQSPNNNRESDGIYYYATFSFIFRWIFFMYEALSHLLLEN